MKTRIGVFDSGVGGASVAAAIRKAFPNNEVILKDDKRNLPYGDKSPEQLLELALPILNELSKQCDVIVVACNTVSTTIIEQLRVRLSVPLIAVEPMIKPATSLSKTGVITVCATPATLASKRYKTLVEKHARNLKVIEPDCSSWAEMIENNTVDQNEIKKLIKESLSQNSDVIVLGCTHYHWIEQLINELVKDKATVLQSEGPIIEQLKLTIETK